MQQLSNHVVPILNTMLAGCQATHTGNFTHEQSGALR
jgi:hypothetical protein